MELIKRTSAALAVAAVMAGLQWISGIPFHRSPDEALYAFLALFSMVAAFTCPAWGED